MMASMIRSIPTTGFCLGLKGTMSEMETATFRQRSQEAIRQMARRGEYYTRIPEGYVLRGAGRLEKDPDEQVRRAIELVFSKFRELGSARQVSLWFRQEQIPVPRRRSPLADPVDFVPATAMEDHGAAQEPGLRGRLCVRPHAATRRPERGTETTGEGEGSGGRISGRCSFRTTTRVTSRGRST